MKNFKYIFTVLIGGTLYGTMSSFVKLAYTKGFHAAELAFSQALLAAAILGLFTFFTRHSAEKISIAKITQLWPMLLTGGSIGLTNYFYYESVSHINASVAIVILMQFTWFSIFLEWICYRKKPSKPELITVLFILCGTVLAGDFFNNQPAIFSIKGIVLALLASFTYAVYIVANSRTGQNIPWQLRSTLIMTGSALMIFAVNSPSIISQNHFGYDFIPWAIFLAVVGTTIPTALFAIGIPKIGAGVSSILMTVELPVAVLCAYIVLHEEIHMLQLVGIVIMLMAISAMNFLKRSPLKSNK